MKHSEKDKLEQFFQNSLENYGENPSADFWSEMENRIPLPPVAPTSFWKMKGWHLFLFLMMGMLFFIGIQKWNNDKTLVDINKTIELQDRAIDGISKELTEVKNEVLSKIIVDSQKELETESKNETPQQYIYNSEREKNSTALQVLENNNNVITKSNSVFLKEKPQEYFLKNKTSLTKNRPFNMSPVSDVENISPLFFEAKFSDHNFLEIPKDELIKFYKNEKGREGIEVFGDFHQLFPNLKIENSFLDFDEEINQESNFGLLLSLKMDKRWVFQVGLGIGYIKQTGVFKNNFEYANVEHEVRDNVVRTGYHVSFKTNYHGLVNFQSYLLNYKLNDNQDIYEGGAFSADIILTKKSKYLFFPVYFKYYLPTKNKKLNWSFKMGFVQRFAYIENEPTSISLSNFSHARLRFSHTKIISVSENLKKNYHTELILGTGIEYLLSKDCTLILEPVLKKSTANYNRIRSHTFGIFTGVRWNL